MVAPVGIRPLGDEDSLRIAKEAVEQWRAVLAALSPIIGVHGVGALYRRTLFLAHATYAWVQVPAESDTMDFESLGGWLARLTPAEAAQARASLFSLFTDLLSSLIGPSLVERLLPAGFPHTTPGAAAQDTPHD